MLNIAAFVVGKNDVFYCDMALKSILPFVKGVFVQDQMSTDGTFEKVCEIRDQGIGNLVVEGVDTGHNDRFEKNYDEPKWRTLAVRRCEELFKPDWILKCDLDEIFTEFFFSQIEKVIRDHPDIEGVRVAGDRFISKTHRSIHPVSMETSPEGVKFVDPHTQVWRAGKYSYMPNPIISGCLHPVLTPDPMPVYWLDGICNIHLHRMFGPKALAFWAEGDDKPMQGPPYHPPTMCPKWYASGVNMGNSEEVKFDWPPYVLAKWEQWGIW